MARPPAFAFAIAFGVLLSSCTGGGAAVLGNMPYAGDVADVQTVEDAAAIAAHRPTGSMNATASIDAFNALGSRVRDVSDQDDAQTIGWVHGAAPWAGGRCTKGSEFFAPDRNGDANSTELVQFYDLRCRHVASDTVRVYAPAGAKAETVNRTTALYSYANQTTPLAVRTATAQFSNATFAGDGMPLVNAGYDRTQQSRLTIGNQIRTYADSEIVMLPTQTAVSRYCQDSAGYNAVGVPSLDRTFGWEGGSQASPAATRTDNGNGYVTWSSTQAGTVFSGPIGTLAIASNTANTSCPIGAPAYSLTGGTAKSTYSIPMSAQFYYGRLWSLAVTGASVHGGYTLNVSTSHPPSGPAVINGTIADGSLRVAAFSVNAFGNGTLTVVSTGAQYRIVDWTVSG